MQVLFLLYHYFNAAEMYNAIRVFIAAYVWMTGFGNYLYYYKTNDFSGVRRACQLQTPFWYTMDSCCLPNSIVMLVVMFFCCQGAELTADGVFTQCLRLSKTVCCDVHNAGSCR